MNMVNITIYSKKDCHLCDVAKETLFEIKQEFPFSLIEIDIGRDKTAFEKYKHLIPVVEIDGKIISCYRINATEVKKILRSKFQPQ